MDKVIVCRDCGAEFTFSKKEVPVRSIERTFALLLMSMCAVLGVFLTAAAIALAF